MRISERALENIRAVIEQQETEWLKDNGFDPVPHRPEPRILRRKTKEGNFSADRFLGNTSPAEEPKQEFSPAPAPAPQEHDNSPEAVEIIPQKDGRHSWLYNEVMKAIRDASGDGTNTKVIAVFVPVVQNGREFEDLPVSAKVELSPVNEENVRIDVAEIPAVESEPEPVEEPEPEEPVHVEPEHEPVEEPAHVEPEPEAASEPVDHVGDLLPTEHIEHDPELVEAFTTIEEKLDEHIAESQEVHEDEEETSEPEIMNFTEEVPGSEEEPAGLLPLPDPSEIEGFDEQVSGQEEDFTDDEIIDEPEEISAGEKMAFTEITLPPALEDDEVIDDGIEIQDDNEDNIKL